MRNLNMTVKIDPKFSAEDWQLYTASMKCTRVANVLNSNLKKLVNAGYGMDWVEREMHKVMVRYSSYGAYDTEPIWVLTDILNQVYKPR